MLSNTLAYYVHFYFVALFAEEKKCFLIVGFTVCLLTALVSEMSV